MVLRNALDYCSRATTRCLDVCVSSIGPVLVAICGTLISFIVVTYFLDVLPGLLERFGSKWATGITAIGLWLLGNLVFNYVCIMAVGPGHMPVIDRETRALLADDPELNPGRSVRWCRKCDKPKAMRAHHCSVCNKCVLKMDHHCPWVNNCVGYGNLRYFILFLFYMVVGAFFFLLTSALGTGQNLLSRITSNRVLFSTVFSFAGLIATGLFLLWNLYLLVTNQSTIEFYSNNFGDNKRRNPYDLGIVRNVREVFGSDCSLLTLAFPSLRRPPGDGIVFPLRTAQSESHGWSQHLSI